MADAAAAGLISFDILRDGLRNLRIAVAELLDGAPRELDSADIHPIVGTLSDELRKRFPGHDVQVRETGRFMRANVVLAKGRELNIGEARKLSSDDQAWRLTALGRQLEDLPDPSEDNN